jgi:hypothetical protein
MNNTTNLTEIFEKSEVGPVLGTYLNGRILPIEIHIQKI